MANVTIPNLASAINIDPSTDLMVIEQSTGTKKATVSQILSDTAISGSNLGITSGAVYTIKNGLDASISDINEFIGDTDIATIGDGTLTSAVATVNTSLGDKVNKTDVITVAKGGTGASDAATARTNLGVAYGTTAGTVCQGNDSRLSDARTPIAHAVNASTYGLGSSSVYGHVKLMDSESSSYGVNNGVAATPKALANKTMFQWAGSASGAFSSLAYPLQIRQFNIGCNHNSTATQSYTKFSHSALAAVAYCGQDGFSAGSTISFHSFTNGSVSVYQWNTQSVNMNITVLIFGY